MAAACLPSKTESTSPKDSSLFSEQTQDFQNSALLSLNHRAQTELVSDTKIWGFFQHFRNMKAWNTPRANCSGFGKWGTWPGLWQFTKPECGEANLQDLGRSCTPVPASATHSPIPAQQAEQMLCQGQLISTEVVPSWARTQPVCTDTSGSSTHPQELKMKVLKTRLWLFTSEKLQEHISYPETSSSTRQMN